MGSGASPDEQATVVGGKPVAPAVTAATATGPDGEAHPSPVAGTVLDRYTILEQVGAGGMGEVFAAYDGKLDRKIALKLLRSQSGELEARLMREAQAMARLAHPNVVAVFDAGHVDDKMYLAMEFVRGETLRRWQKAAPRSLAELLRVYTDAGHGLAAAHAAGLVHRDFKPDNVLVAEDGRIKVTDFGIARAIDPDGAAARAAGKSSSARLPAVVPSGMTDAPTHPSSPPVSTSSTPRSLGDPVTAEGTLLGTPGYMAPEQFLCDAVDARTDQFAFCVSLYEAVYGERPFAPSGSTLEQVAQATLLGKVNEPPKGSTLPAHVRSVLVRGLSPERAARYPSMRELLDDLARDPAKKRRRLFSVLVGAVAITATFAAGARQYQHALSGRAFVCKGADQAMRGIWDETQKKKLHEAFLATASPIAQDTWQRVERAVDKYAHDWVAMRTETCEATEIQRSQSDQVMALRMACLDRRREGLKAYVDVVSSPDDKVVENAVKAALAMTPLDRCTDVATLRMAMPPPEDPAARAGVEALQPKVAELKALNDSGQYDEAIARAAPAIREAEAVHYRPIEAELRFWLAKSYCDARRTKEAEAEDLLALRAAVIAGHDHIVVRAAGLLAVDLGRMAREKEALRWAEFGRWTLERIGSNPELEGGLEFAVGGALYQTNPAEAIRHTERARELWEKSISSDRPEFAYVLGSLGTAYNGLGDYAKGAEFGQRAVTEMERILGPGHPMVVHALANLSISLHQLGRYDETERAAERMLRFQGGTGMVRSIPLELLSEIHRFRGHYAQALSETEEAEREIRTEVGENPAFTADALFLQAQALSELGRHTQAVEVARRAVAMREGHFEPTNPLRAPPYNALGAALRAAGRTREAIGFHEKASGIASAAPSDFVEASAGIGHAQLDLGHFDVAAAALRQALELEEKTYGKEHPGLAAILTGLGRAHVGLGQPAQAIPHLERAIGLAEKARFLPVLIQARFALAQATWASGGSHEAARDLALAAKKDAEHAEGDTAKLLTLIDAWLAIHP